MLGKTVKNREKNLIKVSIRWHFWSKKRLNVIFERNLLFKKVPLDEKLEKVKIMINIIVKSIDLSFHSEVKNY